MLIATIPVREYPSARQAIFQLADRADGIELRLDYAETVTLSEVATLRDICTLPVIFTLRSSAQGGHYQDPEPQRLQTILTLCALNPDYLDLEYDVPLDIIQAIRRRYPAIKLILSYHNFQNTPVDLPDLLQTIRQSDVYAYKIATQAQSTMDALRTLVFVARTHSQQRVIGLCMGEAGQCTRILAPVVGSLFSYAYWDPQHSTAPGQLSLEELAQRYHYRSLNSATKIYPLLGDPVSGSVGHILHNQVMVLLQKNAVYVKLQIPPEELSLAMQLLRQLPVGGASVTMPLKETILPFLNELDAGAQAIQAVNTIFCHSSQHWVGFNTDGAGAMQAIAEYLPLAEQTIVLLGAGGAARALAVTACQYGAKVIILNRSLDKAKQLADELGCEAYALDIFPTLKSYTLCINTLPGIAFDTPILQAIWHPDHILPGTMAMDIVYQPLETYFLRIAKTAGCQCIPGFHMYIAQALLQIQRWFHPNDEALVAIKSLMKNYFLDRTH